VTADGSALEPSLREFVGRVGLAFERRGASGMAGRIVAFLLVAPHPVQSSSQIAQAMQTSSGTVSINTRLLEQMSLIERVSVPGRRGAFFRVRSDAWDTMFQSQIEDVRTFRDAFDTALEALDDANPERVQRLRAVRAFYAFMEGELQALVERWREHLARLAGEED